MTLSISDRYGLVEVKVDFDTRLLSVDAVGPARLDLILETNLDCLEHDPFVAEVIQILLLD